MIKKYIMVLMLLPFIVNANKYEWFSPMIENGQLSYKELNDLISKKEKDKEAYFFAFGYLSSMVRSVSTMNAAFSFEFKNEIYCRDQYKLVALEEELQLLQNFYSKLNDNQKEIFNDLSVIAVYIKALQDKYPCN